MLEGSLEENTLTLLCFSDRYAPQLILRLTADLFSTRAYREIADAAIQYLEQYGKPPGVHLRDLLESKLRREEGKFMATVIAAMEKQAPSVNPDYVLPQLDNFIELRQYANLVERAADAVQAGNLAQARDVFTSVPATPQSDSPGIWLSEADRMLGFMDKRDADTFTSGVEVLDHLDVVPSRKTMTMLIAPPKKGKSMWAVNCGKEALLHRKKVLHITLENSEQLTAQRYVQALFAMTRKEASGLRVAVFERDANDIVASINFRTIDPMALTPENRAKVLAKLHRLRNMKLLIKEFPSGTLSLGQLRAFLNRLERNHHFKPDMLIVDYPDLMEVSSNNQRTDIGRNFVGLRGIAVERELALICPTQGNRSSGDAKQTKGTMVAEDYSKLMTADTILTYSQTNSEHEFGLARLTVEGAREVEDGMTVMIAQSYATGQFCLDSARMSRGLTTDVQRLSGEGDQRQEDEKEEAAAHRMKRRHAKNAS